MNEIRFKLKEMVGFDWDSLNDNQREEVIGYIFKYPLVGAMPNRFGFVKCKKIDENRICGSFTHAHEEKKHRYDDRKEEEKYIDDPFEDFFFILLFDAGLCLLQSRRVRDLAMSMVEERFNETLKRIFGDIGVDFKYLEDISFAVGKDKFIRIFNTSNILYLKVDSLKGRTIPKDFKIFNPDVEKDSMTRAYWDDEFTHIDGLSTSANGGGGLQYSKTSKIALNTGEPKEMEYIEAGKEKLIMKDRIGPSISLDIDIESPKTKDIRREIEKPFLKHITEGIAEKIEKRGGRQTALPDFSGDEDESR